MSKWWQRRYYEGVSINGERREMKREWEYHEASGFTGSETDLFYRQRGYGVWDQ
jgi:hypothetical protein